MTYLHCPRCRFAVRARPGHMAPASCPRCLAHAAIAAPLFASPLNGVELHAAERAAGSRRDTQPRLRDRPATTR